MLDESYCWQLLRYVELHPVRAGMVTCPEEYPWSSASVHIRARPAPDWLDMTEWASCWTTDSW